MALKTESIGPLDRLFSESDSCTVPSIFLSFKSATAPQEEPDEVSKSTNSHVLNLLVSALRSIASISESKISFFLRNYYKTFKVYTWD